MQNDPNYDWDGRVKLGEGSFGAVFKVLRKSDGQFVAIKQMAKSNFDESSLKFLLDEIKIQKDLSHPHIVQLIGVTEDDEFVYITIELCDGSIRDLMEKSDYQLGPEKATHIFKELMEGVRFMVDKNYIHRDVKPENNLFKGDDYKVSDFGFATKADMSGKARMSQMCGTPLYMAPQIMESRPYTAKCDIWSWGIMLYEMVFGTTPWPCRDEATYIRSIKTTPLKFPYDRPVSAELKNFIERCLCYDEGKRIGWAELFEHPYIKETGHAVVQNEEIDPHVVEVLKRFSVRLSNSGFSLEQIFAEFHAKFGKAELDRKAFSIFTGKIDPSLSSAEKSELFKAFDADNSGFVNMQEMVTLVNKYSFQDSNDIAQRTLNDLRLLIVNNKINLKALFDKIDSDRSGYLSQDEFFNFIRMIAPKLRRYDSDAIYNLIDSGHDGKVSINEFFAAMGPGSGASQLENASLKKRQLSRRGRQFLNCLKRMIARYKIPVFDIINQFDMDGKGLGLREFYSVMMLVDGSLEEEELKDLFFYISKGDESITVQDFKDALSSA